MYIPQYFAETRVEVLHDFIEQNSLAAIVTSTPAGLTANHIPLLLDRDAGKLIGHISRANPMRADVIPDSEALAIFTGFNHYVSPSWYPSKQEHGRVVPTWNYAVVHAYGKLSFFDDAQRLREVVERLTRTHEAQFAEPWNVDDAPAQFVDGLLRAIVGFELKISRLEGKWKNSQNRNEADQAGVAAALKAAPRS
jgi:transcriptional regulator